MEEFCNFAMENIVTSLTVRKMNLYNIVFSPTGTSASIAEAVAAGIGEAAGCRAMKCDATYSAPQPDALGPEDCVVIAAPVYGGKMAAPAKERMRHLAGGRARCVLIAVYGNRAFENALNDMAEFAKSLGFVPVAAGAFVGEHSYSTAEYPIAAGRPDREDLAHAEAFGREIGERLSAGELGEVDASAVHDRPSPERSLINFRDFVAGYAKRQKEAPVKILPVVDESLCNGCGLCAGACPTDAIVNPSGEVDGSKCIKCCACVKVCPSSARSLSSPFAPVLSENFNKRKEPVWLVG